MVEGNAGVHGGHTEVGSSNPEVRRRVSAGKKACRRAGIEYRRYARRRQRQ